MLSTKIPTSRDRVLAMGQRLANELNDSNQLRLVQLLESWQAWAAAPPMFRKAKRDGRTWMDVVPSPERARLQKELNHQLARYQFRRQVQFSEDDVFSLLEVPVGPKANSPLFRREVQAVSWLLLLAEVGE